MRSDAYDYLDAYIEGAYYPLSKICILAISDAILTDGFVQKSNASTILNWTWKKLMAYLKSLKIYWFIDENNELYFRHISELNQSESSTDGNNITSYGGDKDDILINWSEQNNERIINIDAKYNKIKRKHTALSIDHLGVDIDIPAMDNINKRTKEVDYTDWFTDLWDIQNNPSRYPEDSIEHAVMLATYPAGDDISVPYVFTDFTSEVQSGSALTVLKLEGITGSRGLASSLFGIIENKEYEVIIDSITVTDIHALWFNASFTNLTRVGDKINFIALPSSSEVAATIIKRYIRNGQQYTVTITNSNYTSSGRDTWIMLINAAGDQISNKVTAVDGVYTLTATELAPTGGLVFGADAGGYLAGDITITHDVPVIDVVTYLQDSTGTAKSNSPLVRTPGSYTLKATATDPAGGLALSMVTNDCPVVVILVVRTESYQVIISEGVLSGDQVLNAPLSLANVDEYHGKYEMPFNTIVMNGAETTAETSKDNRTPSIPVPIIDPDNMSFTALVKLDNFSVEAESLVIKLNGAFAKFVGKI